MQGNLNRPSLLPKKLDSSKVAISPEILTFIAIDDMAVRQAIATEQQIRMRELEESKIPVGTRSLKYTIDAVRKIDISPPWISLSMINDGDSEVYISTNEDGEYDLLDQVPVKKNETFNLNLNYPIIRIVWLRAADGGSASVRIHGIEGKEVR